MMLFIISVCFKVDYFCEDSKKMANLAMHLNAISGLQSRNKQKKKIFKDFIYRNEELKLFQTQKTFC